MGKVKIKSSFTRMLNSNEPILNFYFIPMGELWSKEDGKTITEAELRTKTNFCEGCGHMLSYGYIYVLLCLTEANLLLKDQKHLCCRCYGDKK